MVRTLNFSNIFTFPNQALDPSSNSRAKSALIYMWVRDFCNNRSVGTVPVPEEAEILDNVPGLVALVILQRAVFIYSFKNIYLIMHIETNRAGHIAL